MTYHLHWQVNGSREGPIAVHTGVDDLKKYMTVLKDERFTNKHSHHSVSSDLSSGSPADVIQRRWSVDIASFSPFICSTTPLCFRSTTFCNRFVGPSISADVSIHWLISFCLLAIFIYIFKLFALEVQGKHGSARNWRASIHVNGRKTVPTNKETRRIIQMSLIRRKIPQE